MTLTFLYGVGAAGLALAGIAFLYRVGPAGLGIAFLNRVDAPQFNSEVEVEVKSSMVLVSDEDLGTTSRRLV